MNIYERLLLHELLEERIKQVLRRSPPEFRLQVYENEEKIFKKIIYCYTLPKESVGGNFPREDIEKYSTCMAYMEDSMEDLLDSSHRTIICFLKNLILEELRKEQNHDQT